MGAIFTVAGDYTRFPKILEAYDAGFDWFTRNGHEPAESPLEVWPGPPANDGPFEIDWRYE